MLHIDGRQIPLTEDGFLSESSDWDERVAEALAAGVSLVLTPEHWEIVHFMRGYYARFRHLPNNRMFVKAVQKELGQDKGSSRHLQRLFPESPVRYACLVAGLPKPPGCI
jgi:tRNA 2-thiouridine synthesizing protein E